MTSATSTTRGLQAIAVLAWAIGAWGCGGPSSTPCPDGVTYCPSGQTCVEQMDGQYACSDIPCGNLVLDEGEVCDDGNVDDGDGCSSDCRSDETCGNGTLDVAVGEVCDDNDTVAGDGCNGDCQVESDHPCVITTPGVSADESCESGNCDTVGNPAPGICEPLDTCGNGILEMEEGCEDGDTIDGDGCSAECLIEDGDACNETEPGNLDDASCASGNCDSVGNTAPGICEPLDTCGNSILEAGEGCDDGNLTAADGCNSACRVEDGNPCNDDTLGNLGSDSCASGVCDVLGNGDPGICEPSNVCGNGRLEVGEGCDDGSNLAGDGCDATCLVEDGIQCNDDASGNLDDLSCASGNCDTVGNMAPGICEPLDMCGNGILEAMEGCDDGNVTGGDICSAMCLIENSNACNANAPGYLFDDSCESMLCDTVGNALPGVCEPLGTCGNGVLETGEGCDDGGTASGDGCSAACKIEDGSACNDIPPGDVDNTSCASNNCDTVGNPAPGICEPLNECGNGILEMSEGCDDGNVTAGDGCSAMCLVEDGGACNAGPSGQIDDDSCASGNCDTVGNSAPGVCEPLDVCGNGILEAGDGCDDGNVTVGDGCTVTCLIEDGDACNTDSSGVVDDASCVSGNCDTVGNPGPGVCEPAFGCGNGILETGEGCDDGNATAGDGCSATCLVEDGDACNIDSSGVVDDASCVSGNCDTVGNPGPGVCEPLDTCGNGILEANEGCDDGDVLPGGGCSAGCLIEDSGTCNTDPLGETGGASCASGNCDTLGNLPPGICEPLNTCGNGILEASEGCDDGNDDAGDGCSGTCLVESGSACNTDPMGNVGNASCASGNCDDVGNPPPGTCEQLNACGNGILDANEGCDDGNLASADGCSATCLVEDGGACNDTAPGNLGDMSCAGGNCDAVDNPAPGICEPLNACGNGTLEEGEGCDDGNSASGDGCNAVCQIEDGSSCNADPAGDTDSESCSSMNCDTAGNPAPGVCEPLGACGNSILEAGEGCDDGNVTGGDGCNASCRVEDTYTCNANAPGQLFAASCESGNCDTVGNMLPGVCEPASGCGNSILEAGEGCDDGNVADGDGCAMNCKLEDFKACNTTAPGATGSDSCASGICDTVGNSGPGFCEPQNTCSNSVLETGEGCDDGDLYSGDGCNMSCQIEDGYQCNADPSGETGGASCASGNCDTVGNPAPGVCEPLNTCGNGLLEAGETCDDGNTTDGDGCSSTCQATPATLVAGDDHTCALLATGHVRCWGLNAHGQLGYGHTRNIGDGSPDGDMPPADIDFGAGETAVQLAAGASHTCALFDTGDVRCWGNGADGRLGHGNTDNIGDDESVWAVGNVDIGASAVQIAAGRAHTCALIDTGAVRCWGYGLAGQLGHDRTDNIGDQPGDMPPADIALGRGSPAAIQIALGAHHTCALLDTGRVRCWGLGLAGQLGQENASNIGDRDSSMSQLTDIAVASGAYTITRIAAGGEHTCALLDMGRVRCWGANQSGQLGYESTDDIGAHPGDMADLLADIALIDIDLGAGVDAGLGVPTQLSAGGRHTCAVFDTGDLRCWGAGSSGELGTEAADNLGDVAMSMPPAPILVGGTVQQVVTGASHTCALLDDGSVRCWGLGGSGQLGHGNTANIGDEPGEMPPADVTCH